MNLIRIFLTALAVITLPFEALALEQTATGFTYPTGTSKIPSTSGNWLSTRWDSPAYVIDKTNHYHLGQDLIQPRTSPVYAISDGVVAHVYPSTNPDLSVIWIRHSAVDPRTGVAFSFLSVYGHTQASSGTVDGAVVHAGDVVGTTMPYPRSVDHLHFAINTGGSHFIDAPSFQMSYYPKSGGTSSFGANIGWGRGAGLPSDWGTNRDKNRPLLATRGFVDPYAFIKYYVPAEKYSGKDQSAGALGDFNGDGKADVAAFYNVGLPGQPGTRLYVFNGTTGTTSSPRKAWEDSNWTYGSIKSSVGDFNGDGFSDLLVAYKTGFPGAPGLKIYVFYGSPMGLSTPTLVWQDPTWTWESIVPVAGDFDGDKKTDVAMFYKTGLPGKPGTRLWTFYGTSKGFKAPVKSWEDSNWLWESIKPVAGDFNGDGRADLGAFYKTAAANQPGARLWMFVGGAKGFASPVKAWEDSGWTWESMKPVAGHFNGDSFEDVAVFYKVAFAGQPGTRMWMFNGSAGGVASPRKQWEDMTWTWESMKPLAGDFNGNGVADIPVFYKTAAPGQPGTRMWLFQGSVIGFTGLVDIWDDATWTWESIHP